jgi:hypothetical protein
MHLLARSLRAIAAAGLFALAGCQSVSNVSAIYAVPASLDELAGEKFFDHPWPSDLRMENGSPRLTGFYNPKAIPIIDTYVETMTGKLDGFSPAAAGYVRFTGAIDTASLPQSPRDAIDPSSSVQLLDIDPASPERGQRKLISLRWQEAEAIYYRPNTLAFMPTIGFPLRPHTRYALVVTDALQAKEGGAIAQDATLAKVLGVSHPDGTTGSAHDTLATAVLEIEQAGISRGSIVHLAVFTTADPTKELITVRDGVAATIKAPDVVGGTWTAALDGPTFQEYQGRYGPSPNYQEGAIPFKNAGDGGEFVIQNGLPVLQNTADLRFSLTVPDPGACPMPPDGYPIVLYAHGTGGDWRSYINDGTATALGKHCLAAMGIDQIFQGERAGSDPDATDASVGLTFYNFNNLVAARTNGRQAAIDEVQRARLFTETHLIVPANISKTGQQIKFDSSKLMFFGHSQGGLNGPLFTAIDPSARGGVFSGAGALIIIALLEKTEPQPSIASLVQTLLLGLTADELMEKDEFHPGLSLIQSFIDVVDPLHYARLQTADPREGFAPKSIYMTEGINPDGSGDSYAPPHGIEAHAISIGLPLQLPSQHDIEELAWGGPMPVTVPPEGLAGNLADGKASGILAQWAVPPNSDGHFVVFDVPAAKTQAAQFLQNLAADPIGRVPAP